MNENNKNAASLDGISFHSTANYSIVQEIGRGGMGIVFLAEKDNEGVKDFVVLKTLKTLSKEHEDRLRREANIATGLRHENIVKTYGLEAVPFSHLPGEFVKEIDSLSFENADRRFSSRVVRKDSAAHGVAGAVLSGHHLKIEKHKLDEKRLMLISMDYVEGTDLRSLHREHVLKSLLLPCPIAAFIISRMCRALSYAHQYIVHRDISPENILVNLQGVSKLSDFGVAATNEEEMKLFAGKLCYMSPEQINKEQIDARSDIFSLGLVAYEIITGFNPYTTPPGMQYEDQKIYIKKLMQAEIMPPMAVRSDVPEPLSKIVAKMLACDREQRYQRIEDASNDFEQKYLYASGFGPTNNSLAAYLDIFESGFKNYTQDQLKQLKFLKDEESGKIKLGRKISYSYYTKEGLKLLSEKDWTRVFQVLAKEKMKESMI